MNTEPPPLPGQLGPDPHELAPVTGLAGTLDALLRRPRGVLHHLGEPGGRRLTAIMLFVALVSATLYGLIVGSFSGGTQLWAAPLKIALGLLACSAICFPSLYVFACLTGANARLADVAGLVSGLLALMTVLLVSFAPVAWVFSQSTNSVAVMGGLHLAFWLVATSFGARFLYRGMVRLGARSSGALYVWTVLFVLVALQMMTAIRPLVGTADTLLPEEKRFFLQHWGETMDQGTNP